MTIEIWKPIAGYPGYEVSNCGKVKDQKRLLSQDKPRGYRRVTLKNETGFKRFGVHTLVLSCFVGPRPDAHECNHKNGIRYDNNLDNLEWTTKSENSLHRCRILKSHHQKGSKHGKHKLMEFEVMKIIDRMASGDSLASVAAEFNVCISTVSQIARGKTWKHLERPVQLDRRLNYKGNLSALGKAWEVQHLKKSFRTTSNN